MTLTFKGGLFLDEKKNTADKTIEKFPFVNEYKLPLCQHTGERCVPVVKAGDRVLVAQKIAHDNGLVAANIHSPVSGVVSEVVDLDIGGYIAVKNDELYEKSPDAVPFGEKSRKTLDDLTTDDLIAVVREAGICGMSGAGVPTWKKLSMAVGNIRRIIVNCIECEPYLTVNHRLLAEDFKSVIGGLKILLFAFKIKNANIAISDRDTKLVKKLKKQLIGDEISLKVLQAKYPQGDERQLIYAITAREVPVGKSGLDLGVLTLNAQTVSEIYNAFVFGMPSIYRNLTVDGDLIKRPMNLCVPIGTPTDKVIEYCGLKKDVTSIKVIHGGIMMGNTVDSIDAPIIKTTTGVLVFEADSDPRTEKKSIFDKSTACIRCSRCVDACPMRLIPSDFINCSEKNLIKCGIDHCVLCGLCQYVCPTNVPLMEYIRKAKNVCCDGDDNEGGRKTEHE